MTLPNLAALAHPTKAAAVTHTRTGGPEPAAVSAPVVFEDTPKQSFGVSAADSLPDIGAPWKNR
jgi:hypothetical protein